MTTTVDRRQGVSSSIAIKAPVAVATTANIALEGEQSVDGVAVVANDRVLVKDQTDGTENGIYDVSSSSWSRSPDFDGSYDTTTGTLVKAIAGGTTTGGYWYEVTTTGAITIGTTSLAFSASTIIPGIASSADAIAITIDSDENVTYSAQSNEAKGSDIASAATTNIGAATGNFIDITGTTTITDLGIIQAGTERVIQFDGALTLTYNANSLILPGNASITTAAGDIAVFRSLGAGNWICTSYQRDIDPPTTQGTWTPVLSDGTNDATSSSANGTYTRVGRQVTITGRLITSSLGSVSGSVRITGLPFTSAAGVDASLSVGYGGALNLTAGYNVGGFVSASTSYILLYVWDAVTGATALTGAEWSADGDLIFSATYFV